MTPAPTAVGEQGRLPPTNQTVVVEPSSLPRITPAKTSATSPPASNGGHDLIHPSFLPPCELGRDGDMHAHAFDLLSLSKAGPDIPKSPQPPSAAPVVVPASVPTRPTSILSASRPPTQQSTHLHPNNSSSLGVGSVPKPRRMSSSTTGVLQRGKLGLMGEGVPINGAGKDPRAGSANHAAVQAGSAPTSNRRPVASPHPLPQLFDFSTIDGPATNRRAILSSTLNRRSVSNSFVPASLPIRSMPRVPVRHVKPSSDVAMALDLEDDGDEVDEEGDSGQSGSLSDMDINDDPEAKADWDKLALGSGSGGVKGRRKGMVFRCEHCFKEYRHPSCLAKHRWEHSPHWQEPTQLSMSKHQQVQMLEGAAILARIHPSAGGPLPEDRSVWPTLLSPPAEYSQLLRVPRDQSSFRSPQSSVTAPLTPASLREVPTLHRVGARAGQDRKSSHDSDSTISYTGESFNRSITATSPPNTLGIRHTGHSARPVGIEVSRGHPSCSSSAPAPGISHSLGSLPDMSGLQFQPGASRFGGASPIPNRGNGVHTNWTVPSSSMRSGAYDEDDLPPATHAGRGKSSTKEAEEKAKGGDGEDYGMAMDMEL